MCARARAGARGGGAGRGGGEGRPVAGFMAELRDEARRSWSESLWAMAVSVGLLWFLLKSRRI